MRLLFLVNSGKFFLSHRLPIALAAAREGHEVHVAVPPDSGERPIADAGLRLHTYPLGRRSASPLGEAASLAAIVSLYRRVRPDLVHHVTIKPVLYGSIAARITRVPAVVNAITGLGHVFVAEGTAAIARRRAVHALYRLAFSHPNQRAIFQNEQDRAVFLDAGSIEREHTILIRGSGVDLRAFAPTPEPAGPPIVLLASRMLREKGVEDLVEAARILRRENHPARVVLVGDSDPGNPSDVGRTRLEAWSREGILEWWGERHDMPNVLAQCTLFVLPSYGEGLPKVLIEAAACARAMIATDVPGCREVVQHDETGLLVPPRNAPALADAIRTLLADPQRRARLATEARRRAERDFGLDAVIARTLDLYRELEGASPQ